MTNRCRPAMVESHLPASVREGLREIERLLRIPRGRWNHIPSLAATMETAAARAIIERMERKGSSKEAAVLSAAVALGIGPDTLERRLERWQRRIETSS